MVETLAESRLKLFWFTFVPDRHMYLRILRVFEAAKQRYELRLGPEAVVAGLREQPQDGEVPTIDEPQSALDRMTEWGLLHRTQDAGRVRSIAEYRLRRSVYQMTAIGWTAYRAVEDVLAAKPGDAELRRLVLPAVLDDLVALKEANRRGEGEQVNVLLNRLHATLEDLAERASRFYLMMAGLSATHDARPLEFLEHKDRLIAHLKDFLASLQQHRPQLAEAVRAVEATDVQAMLARAVDADQGVFEDREQQIARWHSHWLGIRAWFIGSTDRPAQADLLDMRTARAISELAALLRRVAEARHAGISRASQLELLAEWFAAVPSDEAGHALFGAAFGLRSALHFSIAEADRDSTSPATSWWSAEPVPVSATLRIHGKSPSPGRPAPVRDDRAARERIRKQQLREREAQRAAALSLVGAHAQRRPLNEAELRVLLRLMSRALQSGRSVSARATLRAGDATHLGTRLRLVHHNEDTVVETVVGRLTLTRLALHLEQPAPRP